MVLKVMNLDLELQFGKEGNRYKYYASLNPLSNSGSTVVIKSLNGSKVDWWLRSPNYGGNLYFARIVVEGGMQGWYPSRSSGVAPGFCI